MIYLIVETDLMENKDSRIITGLFTKKSFAINNYTVKVVTCTEKKLEDGIVALYECDDCTTVKQGDVIDASEKLMDSTGYRKMK